MSARDFSRRSNRRRTNRRFLPKFLGAFGDNHLFGGIGGGIGGDGFGDGLDEDSNGGVDQNDGRGDLDSGSGGNPSSLAESWSNDRRPSEG